MTTIAINELSCNKCNKDAYDTYKILVRRLSAEHTVAINTLLNQLILLSNYYDATAQQLINELDAFTSAEKLVCSQINITHDEFIAECGHIADEV